MSTKELFGDSSSDDEGETPPQRPEGVESDDPPKINRDADSSDDDDDVEFNDQEGIVGVSSTSLAGTVDPNKITVSSPDDNNNKEHQQRKEANWTVQQVTRPNNVMFAMTKMPNLVGIQPEAFDPDTYDPEEEELQHNLIRWRYKKVNGELVRDEKGQLVRESNTRLVEWEDGSWSLHIGNEAFEVDTLETNKLNNFAGTNGYLYLSQTATDQDTQETVGTVLECMGPIAKRLTIRPSSLQSEAHKALMVAVRQKTIKKARIAQFMTQEDPERLKQERIKYKADMEKATRKQTPVAASMYRARPRMSRQYLEEDDRDYDTTNIRALKRGAYEDDMSDYGDDMEDDYGEEDEEVFHKVKPKKRRVEKADDSSEDEELVVGGNVEDDDDDEEINVAKTAAKSRSHLAVLDDEDDSD